MSKSKYLMGVDVGTQSAKVVIFDLQGNIICQGAQPLRPMEIPAPLLAEHPDDDLWVSLQAAFRQAMSSFKDTGREARDILAMGLCVIRCCRVLLKADGSLAHPVISWMDKRLNTPYDHDPRYGEVAYLTTSSGYITQRLTGEFKDTCANYIGWWPMDDEALDWSDDPAQYELNNVPRKMLFEVVKPGQVLGRVTPRAAELTGGAPGSARGGHCP